MPCTPWKTLLLCLIWNNILISADIGKRIPLLETVSYLNEISADVEGKVRVSLAQTQLIIDTVWARAGCGRELDPILCKKCLQASELFEIIGANTTIGLEEKEFEKASVILLYHLEIAVCKMPDEIGVAYRYYDYLYDLVTTTQLDVTQTEVLRFRRFEQARRRVRARPANIQSISSLPVDLSFVEEQLDYILHLISQTYKATTQYKCFTAADVFEEAGLQPHKEAAASDIERLSSVVIANILQGYCIGESRLVSPDEFIRSIFEDYGTFGKILKEDFTKLLIDLGIGIEPSLNHAQHSSDHKSWQGTPITLKRRRKRLASANHGMVRPLQWGQQGQHGQLQVKAAPKHSGCFSADELFHVFDIHESMSVEKFHDMCPALIQQITSKACDSILDGHLTDQSGMVYGWGTLAVFLVTLGSMIGIVIVPLAGVKVYTGLMHLLVALAVSTLSGDALLHLIPEAMGIHSHGVDKPATPQEILNKVILVVGAIYAFFLFERLMVVCLGRAPLTHSRQSLNKLAGFDGDNYDPKSFRAGNSFEVIDDIEEIPEFNDFDNLDKYSCPPPTAATTNEVATTEVSASNDINLDIDNDTVSGRVHKSSNNAGPYLTDTLECRILEETKRAVMTSTSFSFLTGIQATSVLVLIGDAIHNMADGIAIGVGFTLDGYVGSSITIAVFCHELPHEIGDFAVLLKHGMSFRTAFFWSLISNIFGFIGLYIGIALGSNQTLHQWIFAATAGLFLYISLVDLMPEITHDPNGFNAHAFFFHNVGLVLGWSLMMILAYFEDAMKNA